MAPPKSHGLAITLAAALACVAGCGARTAPQPGSLVTNSPAPPKAMDGGSPVQPGIDAGQQPPPSPPPPPPLPRPPTMDAGAQDGGDRCDDGRQNDDESDVDCGGSCPPCDDLMLCGGNRDCESGLCDPSIGLCLDPTCNDQRKGLDESDVDCGDLCAPCADYKMCNDGPDCISLSCVDWICAPAVCGDALVNGEDECDDGAQTATCDSDCSLAMCGDGTTNTSAGEACDDGTETATCDTDCSLATCGDGLANSSAGETCDDGGNSATCDSDCTDVACGDSLTNTQAGEACDDGGETASCDGDCTLAMCGDGYANAAASEVCDDGGESATCDSDCTAPMCGDGLTNMTAGEACDDIGDSAMCDGDCSPATCGDTWVNSVAGESCDDGSMTASCDSDCTAVKCGDSILNELAGEACDDGNVSDGDGCNSTCTCDGFARSIRIAELNIGSSDYLVLTNTSPLCSANLGELQVFFDDSMFNDIVVSLPSRVLTPMASVYVAESPQTGDIGSGGNIFFSPTRGGAVMLCAGMCNSSNGSNVVDLVAFSLGQVHPPFPAGVSFSPSGLTGITSTTMEDDSFTRVNFTGTNPEFAASDWIIGPASRP